MPNKRPGFGLIESLIASGIIVMVAASSVGLSTLILRNTTNFDNQLVANYLASEAIEVAHNIRENNLTDNNADTAWDNGFDCSLGCAVSPPRAASGPAYPNNGYDFKFVPSTAGDSIIMNGKTFIRKVTIKKSGSADVINVEVSTSDDPNTSLASLSETLTNWQEVK